MHKKLVLATSPPAHRRVDRAEISASHSLNTCGDVISGATGETESLLHFYIIYRVFFLFNKQICRKIYSKNIDTKIELTSNTKIFG